MKLLNVLLRKTNPEGKYVSYIQQAEHPIIINPKTGKKYQKKSFKRKAKISNSLEDAVYFGYGFDNEWELAPGNWTFQILYSGQVVVEKTFVIYKP